MHPHCMRYISGIIYYNKKARKTQVFLMNKSSILTIFSDSI